MKISRVLLVVCVPSLSPLVVSKTSKFRSVMICCVGGETVRLLLMV
jgi:hypothetical protein